MTRVWLCHIYRVLLGGVNIYILDQCNGKGLVWERYGDWRGMVKKRGLGAGFRSEKMDVVYLYL